MDALIMVLAKVVAEDKAHVEQLRPVLGESFEEMYEEARWEFGD